MVKKLCVTIPEEMDRVINALCDAISKQNRVQVNKSRVVTLLLEAGLATLYPSEHVEKKGENDGH